MALLQKRHLIWIGLVLSFPGPTLADEVAKAAEKIANSRARIETAVSLIALSDMEKDGQMLSVAAKLLATVGPVAIPSAKGKEGKPEFFDVKALLAKAKSMGADIDKASEYIAMSKPLPAADYCAIGYWRETCDYNNYCRWEYVC